MNDFEQLDQRARLAADDLRSRAAARPRPAFDPADASLLPAPVRLDRHRSRRPFLAAAAVILLVLAAGLALVVRHQGDNDDGPASPTSTTEPPRPFVATDLPKGLAFSGAADARSAGGDRGSDFSPLQVYGPSIDRPELGVALVPAGASDMDEAKPVEVNGRTVYTYDDVGLGKRAVVVRHGKRAVLAVSPVLDREVLASVAEQSRIDGGEVEVPQAALPDGFHLLTEEPDPIGPSGIAALRGGSLEGSMAVYMRDASSGEAMPEPDETAFVTVGSVAGDEARLQAVRLWSDAASETTVRGHRALLTSSSTPRTGDTPALVSRVVTWIERPGELLRVAGYGVSAAELQAVAESVRPVGTKEWSDLVERSQLGEFADTTSSEPSVEIGRGRFADGTGWRLAAEESGSTGGPDPEKIVTPLLIVALGGNSDTSSGVSGSATPDVIFQSNVTLDQGGRYFTAGIVNPSVDVVELRRVDGSVIERAQMVEGGGRRGWVAELTEDPTVIVALAADGRELDQVTFSNLGENESPPVSKGSPTTIGGGNGGGVPDENPQNTVPETTPAARPDN